MNKIFENVNGSKKDLQIIIEKFLLDIGTTIAKVQGFGMLASFMKLT